MKAWNPHNGGRAFQIRFLLVAWLLTLPSVLPAQFLFATNNGSLILIGYTGSDLDVTIPSQTNGLPITRISSGAFSDWSSMTNVWLPQSITNIQSGTFTTFRAATGSLIQGRLLSISVDPNNSFYRSMEGVLFNKAQTKLLAYPQGKAGSYTVPSSVLTIDTNAFHSSRGLTSITVPDSVTTIGEGTFGDCGGATNISLGRNVQSIGPAAFLDCPSLQAITVAANNLSYSSVDGVLFNKAKTTLLAFPGGKAGSYTVPAGVTSLGHEIFRSCFRLTGISFPSGVTTIGSNTFLRCTNLANVALPNSLTNIRTGAFRYCLSLTTLTLPSSLKTIEPQAFADSGLTSITVPAGLTQMAQAFMYCYKLARVVLEPGLTSIGAGAFHNCYSLTNVTIPNSVTNIEGQAFWSTALANVAIPSSVVAIGPQAFIYCGYLRDVFFLGNAVPENSSTFYGDRATIYYLPGTTGWGETFDGMPTKLWLPQLQADAASLGGQAKPFGFNLRWASGRSVVVEACPSLGETWVPLQTLNLTNGSLYFRDTESASYPNRFYRVRLP